MRKIFIVLCFLILSLSLLCAEDYEEPITLRTEINGVSGYPDFGFGLFPVATSFQYFRSDLNIFDGAQFDSKIYFYLTYGFSSVNDSGREWDTGRPSWNMTKWEQNNINKEAGYNKFATGRAFRQYGAFEIWFGQPFFENPVEGADRKNLFEFRVGLNVRYTATTESLSLGAGENPTFVGIDGNPTGIFAHSTPDNPIIAYPWLNGDRRVLSTYLYASLYFYPYRKVRESVQDGVYGYLTFEYSPAWFFNKFSPSGYVASDYYRFYAYLEEKLVLMEEKQDNGWNWLSIYFGHSNTFNHVGGDVVPYYKIPSNYLANQISDRFWLHFMGPNFITSDCFSYVELSLNNNLYFGGTVNSTEPYEGISYSGSLDLKLHLRLFGFIRFEYSCSYAFARGINASDDSAAYPRWSQGATLNFYVSI